MTNRKNLRRPMALRIFFHRHKASVIASLILILIGHQVNGNPSVDPLTRKGSVTYDQFDDQVEFAQGSFYQKVCIALVDKITGKQTEHLITVGQVFVLGTMHIQILRAWRSADDELPEAKVFMDIQDPSLRHRDNKEIFLGWMFQSSASVNALEHPTYDLWILDVVGPKSDQFDVQSEINKNTKDEKNERQDKIASKPPHKTPSNSESRNLNDVVNNLLKNHTE